MRHTHTHTHIYMSCMTLTGDTQQKAVSSSDCKRKLEAGCCLATITHTLLCVDALTAVDVSSSSGSQRSFVSLDKHYKLINNTQTDWNDFWCTFKIFQVPSHTGINAIRQSREAKLYVRQSHVLSISSNDRNKPSDTSNRLSCNDAD